MQVSVESTSTLGRKLTIDIPATQINQAVEDRLKQTAKNIRLDGFRPGKVPLSVIKKRFGEGVRQEVLGEMMQESLYSAIQQEKLLPAAQPTIDPQSIVNDQEAFRFSALFEVYPEVQLADFSVAEIEKPVADIEDADVTQMLDNLRRQRATWEVVARPAADGDKLKINFAGTLDGEAFEGGSAEDFDLTLGSGQMIPGFESGLEGAQADEERTLDLSFPEDYHSEELKGKAAQFKVLVKEVQTQVLPEIDEEFLSSFGVKEGGEEAFEQEVRKNMQRELQHAMANVLKHNVLNKFQELNALEVPEGMVKSEIDRMKQQMLQQMQQPGANSSMPELSQLPDDIFADQAKKRVTLGLLLNEYMQANKIQPGNEAVQAKVAELAETYEEPEQVIQWYNSNQEQLDQVRAVVAEDMAVTALLDSANIVEKSSSYEEIVQRSSELR